MAKRVPFIAIRTDFLKDEAVSALGDIAGYNVYEARGRLVTLWCWCRDRGLEDAPEDSDLYAVPEAVVRRFLGPAGVGAILGGGCDELALGVRFRDGLIQLRGSDGDVARLRDLSRTRQAGGRARAGGERDDLGRFGTGAHPESVAETTVVQHDSGCESSKPPAGIQQHPPLDQRSEIRDQSEREVAAPPLHLAPPGPKRRKSRPARAVVSLPEGWEPRQHERDKARDLGLDPVREAERFRNNALAKGHVYADWDAAFRTWIGNAPDFNASRGPPSAATNATGIRSIPLLQNPTRP